MFPSRNCNSHFPVGKPKYFTELIPEMNSPCQNTLGSSRAGQCTKNYNFH